MRGCHKGPPGTIKRSWGGLTAGRLSGGAFAACRLLANKLRAGIVDFIGPSAHLALNHPAGIDHQPDEFIGASINTDCRASDADAVADLTLDIVKRNRDRRHAGNALATRQS